MVAAERQISAVKRFPPKFGGDIAALNHDREISVLKAFKAAVVLRWRDKTQPHRRILRGAERAAGDKTDDLSVAQHRFIVVQHGIGIGQPEQRGVACQACR